MAHTKRAEAATPKTATVHAPNLMRSIVLVTIGTLIGMSAYEGLKQRLFPAITTVQSQVMTIIFTTIVVMIVTYAMTRRYRALVHRQKQVEIALLMSEQRYRQIFSEDQSVKLLIDPITQAIVEANPAASAYYGYSVDALQRMKMTDLNVAIGEQGTQHVTQTKAGGTVEVTRHHLASGALRDVEIHDRPIEVDGQRLRYAIVHDITERKHTEEALAHERQQLRQIVEKAPVAIAMFDTEMRYLAHSTQFLTDNGMPPETSLVGRSHYEVSPDIPERFRALDRRALKGETLSCLEDPTVWPDGNITYLRWAMTPWHKLDGSIGGVVLVTQNIKELVEARETALAASRLKSEFLATMSHEIRTPMNGVLGMTELVLATPLTTDQRDYIGVIRDSGQALLTIIDDILDFSKVEAGQMVLDPTDFAPGQLIEAVAEVLVARAHAKQVDLLTYVAPDVPSWVHGDIGRLRQIMLNLAGNAVKFTDHGEVSVRVTVDAETDTAVTLRFAVYDTGIGLSAADRERLFQPFTQADGSMARRYGGTGLGLAISKRLVELMGGTIGVESVVGQGSTFWFSVPLQRAEAAATPVVGSTLDGLRVLVVDGSATNRAIVRGYLEAWNVRSDGVATDGDGIARLRAAAAAGQPYALTLIDAALPGGDTLAFVQSVLDDPSLASTRLVLMQTLETRLTSDTTPFASSVGHLAKPIRQSQLWDTIMNGFDPVSMTSQDLVPVPTALAPDPASAPAPGVRLLVAEDNPVNQKLTLRQLAHLGYQADAVSNGREAVVAAGTGRYNLVLMDCQMPELDGFDATAQIRQAEARLPTQPTTNIIQRMPVIALTANAMQGDREACLAAGMDDYLTKPVQLQALRAVLERWIPAARADIIGENALDDRPDADQVAPGPLPPPIVSAVLDDLRTQIGDAPEVIDELIDLFLTDLPSSIAAMRAAIAAGDASALSRAAHRSKGSSASLGALRLSKACQELETLGKGGTTSGAATVVDALEAEYRRVADALTQQRTSIVA